MKHSNRFRGGVRLLTGREIDRITQGVDLMPTFIDVLETAFEASSSSGQPGAPMITADRDSGVMVASLMGSVPELGLVGGSINAIGRPPIAGSTPHRGYRVLFDQDTLNLVCLMELGSVHRTLVGATVGLATRWLARTDVSAVGVIGSGTMALASLEGICAVRSIKRVLVFSTSQERRSAFAAAATERFGVKVRSVGSAQEAAARVDVITCATNTHFRDCRPVINADWVARGTHINSIGRDEIDAASHRALNVYVPAADSLDRVRPPWQPLREQAKNGDIPPPIALADVIAGNAPGRSCDADRTMYISLPSIAQHLAIAHWIYERACKLGVGSCWDQGDEQVKELVV